MSVATFFQENGLHVEMRTARVLNLGIYASLTEKLNAYSHVVSASGGYDSANIQLLDTLESLDDWLNDGLGREIYTYNPDGEIRWHGFINTVTLETGIVTVQRGPLMEVANRVSCTYTPIENAQVDPPVTGEQKETVITEDADSQAKYGILEEIVSIGQALDDGTTNDAEEMRDTYLAENSYPQTSNTLSLSPQDSSNIVVTLECLGYIHWMNKWVYNYTPASPLLQMAYQKIEDVIDADPNGWFSSTNADIEQNAVLVPEWEDNNSTALSVINNIVQLGNGSFARMTFGVYGDMKCVYATVSSQYDYAYNMMGDTFVVTNIGGGVVKNWDILPAKWVIMPDFLIGSVARDEPSRTDPRALFIERVQYTAPYSVELVGEKVNTIPQKLARLGVGGLG